MFPLPKARHLQCVLVTRQGNYCHDATCVLNTARALSVPIDQSFLYLPLSVEAIQWVHTHTYTYTYTPHTHETHTLTHPSYLNTRTHNTHRRSFIRIYASHHHSPFTIQ